MRLKKNDFFSRKVNPHNGKKALSSCSSRIQLSLSAVYDVFEAIIRKI
jgi:hypothetical protein